MAKKLIISFAILLFATISLVNTATLTCSPTITSCSSYNITPVTAQNEYIGIAGAGSNFVSNEPISFSFSAPSVLNFVPTQLFRSFSVLQSMSFMNVSLTNLVTDAFQNCGRLTTISIYYNPLTKIPASFASTCINVTSFMAYANQIQEIDVNAFKGLEFLQFLYLSDNKIACLPAGVFQNTPIVQSIDLRNNLITILDPKTFTNLPNLNSITLSSNKIIALPALDFTLTGMTMGLNFMVDTNPIQAIHKDFIIKFFTSRSNSMGSNMVGLYNYGNENITTCIPKDSLYGVMSPSYYNWPVANLVYRPCYNNWKDEYARVSCGSSLDSTTTNPNGGSFQWPFKNFFAILSNGEKNFSSNVQFNG